jgi:hypothetical protein
MPKFIRDKSTIILTILAILIITFIFSVYYVYNLNLKKIEEVTWEYWETGDTRRGGLVIENSMKDGKRREFFIIGGNFISSVTTQTLLQATSQRVTFETFYIERTGINSFEVRDSVVSSSTDLNFEEALEIARRYDIYKNSPYPEKISSFPELNLTPEEIERNQESVLSQKENQRRIQELERFNTTYPYLRDELAKIYKDSETISTQEQIDLIASIELVATEARQSFDNGQVYTFPDGSIVQPSDQAIQDMESLLSQLYDLQI